MTSRPAYLTGRGLLRLAVAGAVAIGTPIALAGNAEAAPASVWDQVAQCESGGNWAPTPATGTTAACSSAPAPGAPTAAAAPRPAPAASSRSPSPSGCSPPRAGARGRCARARPVRPATRRRPEGGPEGRSEGRSEARAKAAPAAKPAAPVAGGYTVKAGDTLSSIAAAQNVAGGWKTLSTMNGLPNANVIHPGQVLRLS